MEKLRMSLNRENGGWGRSAKKTSDLQVQYHTNEETKNVVGWTAKDIYDHRALFEIVEHYRECLLHLLKWVAHLFLCLLMIVT